MSIFTSLKISGSALTAERMRMDVISGNVANVDTTRSSDGGPYKRREVVLSEAPSPEILNAGFGASFGQSNLPGGVQVAGIVAENGVRLVNDPSNPDADANGNVAYPDIDIVHEMTNMMSAVRAYEASVTVANAAKSMAMKALDLGKG